jgi:hypothetical protein
MKKAIRYRDLILDKDTLDYIHQEVTKLEIDNWDKYHHESEYSRGKNIAYREIVRSISNVLNR